MFANGSSPTKLTDQAIGDDREPDCTKSLSPPVVVFSSNMDHSTHEIYTVPITGGTPTRLTFNSTDDDDPTWCGKDDEEIVFARQVNLEGCLATQPKHIILMDRHGTAERQVTCGEHNHSEPACSPQGDQVAFRFAANCGTPPGNAAIHKMATTCSTTCTAPLSCSTANCFSCTQTALTLQDPASNNTEPRWSLGGTMITFSSYRLGPEDGNTDWEIYKMDSVAGEDEFLDQVTTNNPHEDRSPDWSEIRP
jgi:Tol biopolymer transport system component